MKLKKGDKVKVEAVSKHGKNRIRENGDTRVVRRGDFPECKNRRPSVLLDSLDGTWWRWVALTQDKDFKLIKE